MGVAVVEDPDQYSTDFTKCLKYLNAHVAEIIAFSRQKAVSEAKRDNAVENSASSQPTSYSTLEIVILGGLGGRVDQAFSQIHHLYLMTQNQREIREANQASADNKGNESAAGGNLYLVSEESITFILQQGKNIIRTPATKRADIAEALEPQADGSESRKRKRDQESEYFFEENIGIIPISAPASITTRGFEWDVQDWHTEIGGQISTSNHIRADTVEVETSVPVLFTVELAERLKRG
jgi:thiamine pyrophosphokinase